jgi:cation-transporting ATPase I
VVETPGISQFFGCTPIGPVSWAIVLAAAAVGTVAAGLAPRLLPAS